MKDRVYKGDTALIDANLFDEDGVNPLPATAVSWQIRKPDGTISVGAPQTVDNTIATIIYGDTDQPGQYAVQVTFDLTDATTRSTVLSFEVTDPLETSYQSATPQDEVVDRAWMKLEDLFDSELGGPHVRDRTLANFDRHKMARFVPDALYNINNYYTPATGFDETSFPYDVHGPLLSQALLIEAIRHLERSYVEQWTVSGNAAPGYFDRRDYMNRWGVVRQSEEQRLFMWLDLFKRGEMGFGNSSLLVGGYASYSSHVPRYMRGRYPYIPRY